MTSNNLSIQSNKGKQKKIRQKKSYFFLKDKIFIWTIISFIMVFFMIISFLNIKGLTSIHTYTFGLFFGMFSIAIFVYVILLGLKNIFKMKNTYSAGVFHFSLWRFGILLIALMILGTSIYYAKFKPDNYTAKNAFSSIFEKWYIDFSDYGLDNAWLPNKWTPGIIFTFIYVLISFPGIKLGMILSFILSIIFFLMSITLFFLSDNLFKKIFIKRKKNLDTEPKTMTNINLNLEKQDLFEQDKKNIIINDKKNELEDEIYLLNINKNIEEKDKISIEDIQIIPDEPDFRTQEIDLSIINQHKQNNNTENINKNNSQNIEIETKEFEKEDFFDNEYIDSESKENKENKKDKRYAIIQDKEDLF